MKLFFAAVFLCLVFFAFAEAEYEIDWSKVVPRMEVPGFFKNRLIKSVHHAEQNDRTGRIVGGYAT